MIGLKTVVQPMLADLRLYTLGMRTGAKRTAERSHVDDHRLATEVLDVTEHLSSMRRRLVRRRCRRVFGNYWATLAEEMPYAGATLGTAVTPALFGAPKLRASGALNSSPIEGLLQRAYTEEPSHPTQASLRRELRRLAAGW